MERSYPTEPVIVVLADGKERRLRYPAAALKRVAQAQATIKKESGATDIDILAATLWHGLIDREGISKIECTCAEDALACACGSLFGLIDARALPHINAQVKLALPEEQKNPPAPVSAV